MTGLYIHIPFCVKRCHYCDFVMTTAQGSGKKDEFLAALEKEVAHRARELKDRRFDTIYLGGGTPSTLDAGQIRRVFSLVRAHFGFQPNLEITCEVNPGDLDREKIDAYRELGINRVSLGAQSFNDKTLNRINRAHESKDIEESFSLLREGGFKNINIDLILSLPGETLKDVEHSLGRLRSLNPEHVSIYELTIEERTVFGHQYKRGVLKLPAEEEELKMLSCAEEFLERNGYVRYELLNYAKPGFESCHNRLYWANEETLGLGPGAFSYVGGRRYRHSSSVDQYLEKAARGDWSALEEEMLTPEKKEIESFLLSLRLLEGSNLEQFPFIKEKYAAALSELVGRGFLERENGRVHLTPRGRLFAESVFTELSSPC